MSRAMALVLSLTAVAAHAYELVRVAPSSWCVTRGSAGDGQVSDAKMRAVAPGSDGNRAELRFVYRGPSASTALLGSGELRRQIGLKLRAQDGCNLVYVMWRIEPKPQIVVSVKRNPGQRTHAECGNRGYQNLRGAGVQPRPIAVGEPHALRAELDGSHLRVWADGAIAWEGDVGPVAAALAGPVGVRTDNGRFDVDLHAARGPQAARCGAAFDEE